MGGLVALLAQNPIVPPGVYIADPTARQWGDGKMYIYGSRDERPGYYCSWTYHVLSSEDLLKWRLHPNAFASKGDGDQVGYSDDYLYAPDCHYRDGRYYLYYCLANNHHTNGVAIGDLPQGPFTGGVNINTYGYNEIDPAVFIDDDGQGYFIWGQFNAKMARLMPCMTRIDSSSIVTNVVTEQEHFFHEGAFLAKRNGIYYMVYAHMGRAGRPTCIGYATSEHPLGPYHYRGVIIDNDHCDPGVWNNHGSIAEFNGQWYVFYHRSTHGSNTMRKACVEPISFKEDGSIPEVEMTSQGAGDPFVKGDTLEAEQACLIYGNTRIQAFSPDQEELGGITSGDEVAYKYIDFNSGIESVTIRVFPGENPGVVELVSGNPWDPLLGWIEVPASGPGDGWLTLTTPLREETGEKALWLRFKGQGADFLRVDWLYFE